MLRRRLLLLVALASVLVVTVVVVALVPGRRVVGAAVPYCTVLQVLFDADEDMWRTAEVLRGDRRVREVRDERTKAVNHERLTASLRAQGRHGLADAARVSATPASLRVVEAFGVDVGVLAGELRRGHRVNHVDVCADPDAWPEEDRP